MGKYVEFLNENFDRVIESILLEDVSCCNSDIDKLLAILIQNLLADSFSDNTIEVMFKQALEDVYPDYKWFEITSADIHKLVKNSVSYEEIKDLIIKNLLPEFCENC